MAVIIKDIENSSDATLLNLWDAYANSNSYKLQMAQEDYDDTFGIICELLALRGYRYSMSKDAMVKKTDIVEHVPFIYYTESKL